MLEQRRDFTNIKSINRGSSNYSSDPNRVHRIVFMLQTEYDCTSEEADREVIFDSAVRNESQDNAT